MGLPPRRPKKALPPSSTEARAAGHLANLAIQGDNIEASSAHRLARAGLLVAEASVCHQAGLSAQPPGAAEVLSAALAVVVPLETPMAVGALMEEAMEEATAKLEE